ncbi:MAG: bifunctional diaminohydroxyphosphoribosylaminopyrimidine deaminase/5-amino-6-(5-phosphoribosylamino)uracil reductase RibD, partial [Firmicutes bacterium]|nr:bifunctional diaminohydroxyphosphoribosylaminopyrimidine deaminase/5-amino-6-(5-phosphoribosylamino)uracil reductase RibD [Bacillota bacterium]
MRRALELALRGAGGADPNPLVGAVIVRDGKIIGEGFHEYFGGPHAEVNAFSSLKESAEGAEMYVTLEPCSHYGKTPPCAEAVVKNKIKKVYIGMTDPNPKVAGRGMQILKNAGIDVETGILETECRSINAPFIKHITTGLPYIVLKWAMSLDGKIACRTGESKWISCEQSRAEVQALRNRYMGIMAGINTVLADDPLLTCRIEGGRAPYRIICDSNLKIPENAKVLGNDGKCIIATVS